MLILLAVLLSSPSVPGCRYVGASISCELDALPSRAPPAAKPPPVWPAARRHRASHHRRSHAAPRKPQPKNPAAVTDADVQRHIESLTAIGDCSGVKAYAATVRPAADSDAAYGTCLGKGAAGAPAAPPAPAAGPATPAPTGKP